MNNVKISCGQFIVWISYLVFSIVFEFLIDVFKDGPDELHKSDDEGTKGQSSNVIS